MSLARAAGLALGFVADRVLGDPERHHPVAWFGTAASRLEQRTFAPSRRAGVVHEAVLVGGTIGLGCLVERWARRPWTKVAASAVSTFVVLGGTTLAREAAAVAERMDADDLPGSRAQVARIVGRRTDELSAEEVARAAVETVAENTSDAVVAPLLWGGAFGVPGLLGYRAINTLDAMVGHKNARYRAFGWAAARLDDAANWLPARVCAALVALVRPSKATDVARIVSRDSAAHPSPNAGKVESAFAAALGVRLGGSNSYDGQAEDRGTLGDGPSPGANDIGRAIALSRAVGLASAGVACAIALVGFERGRRGPRPAAIVERSATSARN